jgi:hypothetical protein
MLFGWRDAPENLPAEVALSEHLAQVKQRV